MRFMTDTATVAAFLSAEPLSKQTTLTLLIWLQTIQDEIEMQDRAAETLDPTDRTCLLSEVRTAWDTVARLQVEIVARQRGEAAASLPAHSAYETHSRVR